jgi:heptosyltransferase III
MDSAPSEQVAQTQRMLVIFPGALGDLVCLAPALEALARRHPGTTLELMARAELARFAVDRFSFARIEAARGDSTSASAGRSRAHSRPRSIDRREVAALFAEDGDLTEAAEFFRSFTRIHSFFASEDARFRHALAKAAALVAVSFHAFRPAGAGHVATAYLNELGGRESSPDEHPDGRIDVLPGDLAEAAEALAGLGLAGARFILFFPGSGGTYKNWPADNFAALASAVAPPLRTLVVLGPAEAALEPLFAARGIARLRDQPLSTVAGLARLAAGFVGNDSGVSHLAAAAGAPGVVLFGPTDPDRWRPMGRVTVIRRMPLADLAPSEVTAALREILIAS